MSAPAGENKLQARTRSIAKPIVTRLWTIEREGYDRLPEQGPAILCPNHISFLDSAFLMLTGRINYLANAVSVAEYVIGAMFVLVRGVYGMTHSMLAGEWPRQGHAFGREVLHHRPFTGRHLRRVDA